MVSRFLGFYDHLSSSCDHVARSVGEGGALLEIVAGVQLADCACPRVPVNAKTHKQCNTNNAPNTEHRTRNTPNTEHTEHRTPNTDPQLGPPHDSVFIRATLCIAMHCIRIKSCPLLWCVLIMMDNGIVLWPTIPVPVPDVAKCYQMLPMLPQVTASFWVFW